MATPRVYATNRLVKHVAYPKIMSEYNARLARDGEVNGKKFYEEIVSKEIPSYSMAAWYQFLKRFKTDAGITLPGIVSRQEAQALPASAEVEQETAVVLQNNHQATADMIMRVLNISAQAAKEVLENPELIPYEKRIELGLKVMKAQDSRVKAIGGMRADVREQERFDRMQDSAAYG